MNLKFDLRHGDCLEVLKTLPDNSIDAVVTDPPYGLEFMGKDWDSFKTGRSAQYAKGGRLDREGMASRSGKGGAGPSYVNRPAKRCKKCGKQAWSGSPCECAEKDWELDNSPLHGFQAFCEAWAREVLRVLKPGGHCVAFSATRTGHRMAVAMEDAGFEVRDTCAWVFGSGFPKSLNVSERLRRSLPADIQCSCAPDCQQTAQDSPARYSSYNDRDGEQPLSDLDGGPSFPPSLNDAQGHSPYERKGDLVVEGQYNHSPSCDRHSSDCLTLDALSPLQDCQVLDSAPFDISLNKSSAGLMAGHRSQSHISSKQHLGDGSAASSQSISGDEYPYIPRCRSCGKLKVVNGLGSALKPAWEMIYLCRKPLSEPTIAANVLRWGTGAINVDGCRVEAAAGDYDHPGNDLEHTRRGAKDWRMPMQQAKPNAIGRFPANLCHDGSQEVLDLFPETATGFRPKKSTAEWDTANGTFKGGIGKVQGAKPYDDSGSAARFYYCSKASKHDRAGSRHPTVKPVKLMQWLCRMVTPPGGVVLDPFAGSGTTGAAAILEGFQPILIEREDEYVADIHRRLGDLAKAQLASVA